MTASSSRWGGCSPDAAAPEMTATPTNPDNPPLPPRVAGENLDPQHPAMTEQMVADIAALAAEFSPWSFVDHNEVTP